MNDLIQKCKCGNNKMDILSGKLASCIECGEEYLIVTDYDGVVLGYSVKLESSHFEGDIFEVDIHINSDSCFLSRNHFETDYEGYKKIKALINELHPANQAPMENINE